MNPKHLIGKTIARVDMNPTRGDGGATVHNPHVFFTDGSHISFAPEDDADTYGVDIIYTPAPKKARRFARTCACGLPYGDPVHKESSKEFEHIPFAEVPL